MRLFTLLAVVALLSVGCQSFRDNLQFGDQNHVRANIGGGARWGFADIVASDNDEDHGTSHNAISGGVRVGTVVYEDKNVQADIAAGPQFGTFVEGTGDGTTYGADVDVRIYCKAFENLAEWLEGVNPFVTAGTGFNYTDVDALEGSGKWGMPLKAGLGVRYEFNEEWSATVEYNLHHLTGLGDNWVDNGHTSHGTSTDMVILGVQYNF